MFSRPYSLTLTVRAVILFTALLSTHLLRDATVFIFVDRPPCPLQESSSRPRVLLRLSSSRRPTYPRARRRLPILESIRAACRPRRHISSLTPVRPDYSHQVPRGCCDFSSIPAPIPVCADRQPVVGGADGHTNKLPACCPFLSAGCVCGSVGRCFLSLCVLLSALPAEPAGHARSIFFTLSRCQQYFRCGCRFVTGKKYLASNSPCLPNTSIAPTPRLKVVDHRSNLEPGPSALETVAW